MLVLLLIWLSKGGDRAGVGLTTETLGVWSLGPEVSPLSGHRELWFVRTLQLNLNSHLTWTEYFLWRLRRL